MGKATNDIDGRSTWCVNEKGKLQWSRALSGYHLVVGSQMKPGGWPGMALAGWTSDRQVELVTELGEEILDTKPVMIPCVDD